MANSQSIPYIQGGRSADESAGKGSEPQPKMTEDDLKSIIKREQDSALGIDGGLLSQERRHALEYYQGSLFGDESEHRSQVVMRSVFEAIEWIMPALLRIFCTPDHVVEFEPRREQDIKIAELQTTYINYIFYHDNQGFLVLHDWFKDALIQKVGWVKVWWDTQEYIETNSYGGLTEQEYQSLLNNKDAEVIDKIERTSDTDPFDEDAPTPGYVGKLYDCTIRTKKSEGRVKVEPVAPEEVLLSRRAKGVEYIPYVCHRRQRTVTDLIEDGYDRVQALRLQGYDENEYNVERIERYEKEDDFPYATDRTDPPMRIVWVEENYIRVDWDGDGIAELRKVTTAGNAREILIWEDGKLDNEEVDEVPLIPITPIRMPHKLVGMSVAETVMDLQRIRSALMRQMLDNLYLTNAPRIAIEESAATENTYDDLLTVRPGGLVRTGRNNGLLPLEVPFVAKETLPILQYLDTVSEQRSGVAPHNQNIDSDILNQSSSGLQTHLMMQAAAQRVELIARVFAETGVRTLMQRILGLVCRYQQKQRIIRITDQWLPMDPRQWRDVTDATISVGLGTGNRDQMLAHLMQILQVQAQIIAVQKGVQGPLVTAKNVFDVVERLTENAGFKESFFTDPTQPPPPGSPPPQQSPPDPEMVKAQGMMQIEQQRMQAQLQMQKAKGDTEMQVAMMKAQLDMQINQKKAEHDIQIEQMREQFEQQKAMHEMQLKAAGGFYNAPQPQQNGSGNGQ